MSQHTLPPNPCLSAIILVIRTSAEPRLVFHYPPKPEEDNARFNYLFKDDRVDTSSTSSDTESSVETEAKNLRSGADSPHLGSSPEVDEAGSGSPFKGHGGLRKEKNKPRWNDLFGHTSSMLARTLCPASGSLKRFEVNLEEYVYLGRPSYANEDGSWKKKRRCSSSMSKSLKGKESRIPGSNDSRRKLVTVTDTSEDESAVPDNHSSRVPSDTLPPQPSSRHGSGGTGEDAVEIRNASATPHKESMSKNSMLMFHVVFVIRPSPLEYHSRVKDLWVHIVKKFSKALKWEQAVSHYVSKEISSITSAVKRHKKSSGITVPSSLF